ncbi:MAG: hypothetical protein ACD_45C00722G0002 [uncultured bacterium]|nr:MAG: hypothetical protein ACD_45C00722G0002 [uncultured bacterium]OGT47606.1 MAG: hypothetical protein A3E83_06910 [Gammaproteobacteria bacterium RIFCSPHIGHO2_12_FULL_41_20]HLB43509.1 hypothetical protein [Gammaproteobacteria bacterium]
MRKIVYVFSFLFFLIDIPPAYAYIDPGTGSMLLQGLIAGIISGFALLSVYYKKIKNFLLLMLFKNKKEITPSHNNSD